MNGLVRAGSAQGEWAVGNQAGGFMSPRFRRSVPRAARTFHRAAVATSRVKGLARDDNQRLG